MLVNVSHYYYSVTFVVRIRTNYEYNVKSYEKIKNISKKLKLQGIVSTYVSQCQPFLSQFNVCGRARDQQVYFQMIWKIWKDNKATSGKMLLYMVIAINKVKSFTAKAQDILFFSLFLLFHISFF
jgi:hypothetical protein